MISFPLCSHGRLLLVVNDDDPSEGTNGSPVVDGSEGFVVGAKKGEDRRMEEERVRKEEGESVGAFESRE